jgi:predicted chitinase
MRANEFIKHQHLSNVDEGLKDIATAGLATLGLMGAPNVSVDPQPPTQTQVAPEKSLSRYELLLKNVANKAGIKGIELAQFLAQVKHESWDFNKLKEKGTNIDFKKYDIRYNPRKAKILGNVKPGDGARYYGRGFIQLTGRDNYKRAGAALNLPLEKNPELAAKPDIAAKIAVWFWKSRVKPNVTNFKNTAEVTKYINPGMAGLADRHDNFKDYMKQGTI